MPTPRALRGSLLMPLELVILSVAHASSWSSHAAIGACSWNSCSLCPIVLECMCRERGCYGRFRPSLHMPSTMAHHHCGGFRLSLHTLLAAVAPESSPFRLFLHSQPWSSPQIGPLKPELQLPVPTGTSGCVSQAGECTAEALSVCTGLSLFCLLQTGSVLSSEEAPFLSQWISLLVKGLHRMLEPFLLHSSLPGAQLPF